MRLKPVRIRHVASLDGRVHRRWPSAPEMAECDGRADAASRWPGAQSRIERTFCGQHWARPWTTPRPRWTTRPGMWTNGPGRWTNGHGGVDAGASSVNRDEPYMLRWWGHRTTTSCGFGLDHHPAAAYSSKVAPAPDDPRNHPERGPTPLTGHRTDHRRRNDPTDDAAATRHPFLVTADRQRDGAPSLQTASRPAPGTLQCPRGRPHPRRRQQAWSRRCGNGGERTNGAGSRGDPGHG